MLAFSVGHFRLSNQSKDIWKTNPTEILYAFFHWVETPLTPSHLSAQFVIFHPDASGN